MVNHPNRNSITSDKMRAHLVAVTRKFATNALSELNKINDERLILLADWESRQIFITIVSGPYGTKRVQQGLDESFEVEYLIPKNCESKFDFICNTQQGRDQHGNVVSQDQFDVMYQAHILDAAMAADRILGGVPEGATVSDDVKSQVRDILEPYRSEYHHEL